MGLLHKHNILVKPIFTEKTNLSKDQNKYVFEVNKDASKIEISKVIKDLFKVEVLSVNTVNYEGKKKRLGRFLGKKSDWKKAIVTLKSGNTINFVD